MRERELAKYKMRERLAGRKGGGGGGGGERERE